jgi:YHS domain-containing protein
VGLIRFIITFVIIYFAYQFVKKLFINNRGEQGHLSGQKAPVSRREDLVEDPYCHTYIPLSDACQKSVRGKTLYFCSKKCLEEFMASQNKEI